MLLLVTSVCLASLSLRYKDLTVCNTILCQACIFHFVQFFIAQLSKTENIIRYRSFFGIKATCAILLAFPFNTNECRESIFCIF